MQRAWKAWCGAVLAGLGLLVAAAATSAGPERYVRFQSGAAVSYGRLHGDAVVPLSAAPWLGGVPAGAPLPRAAVTLLAPVEPGKVIAEGSTM